MASAAAAWRAWNFEQRTAATGALLLLVSTFGPFSFVEAALVLVAAGVLWLLKSRAEGKRFHLPFGDGSVILAAGVWSALLIVVRLFDRPLGQNLLALACAGILVVAGLLERAKRPPDDLPEHAIDSEEPDFDLPERSVPSERPRERPAEGRSAAPERSSEPAPPTSAGPATPAARRSGQPELPGLADRPADVPEPETPPEFEPTKKLGNEGADQPE
jgi:hypothetical protein